jgi:hypothetical protein
MMVIWVVHDIWQNYFEICQILFFIINEVVYWCSSFKVILKWNFKAINRLLFDKEDWVWQLKQFMQILFILYHYMKKWSVIWVYTETHFHALILIHITKVEIGLQINLLSNSPVEIGERRLAIKFSFRIVVNLEHYFIHLSLLFYLLYVFLLPVFWHFTQSTLFFFVRLRELVKIQRSTLRIDFMNILTLH